MNIVIFFGRILFSAPFACTAYFLLFYVPGGYHEIAGEDIKAGTNWSMEYKLAYYFIFFCIFEGLVTVCHMTDYCNCNLKCMKYHHLQYCHSVLSGFNLFQLCVCWAKLLLDET